MNLRFGTYQAMPDRIDQFIRVTQEQLLPVLHQLAGFQAGYSLVDRPTGTVIAAIVWESEQAWRAAAEATAALRQQGIQAMGATTAPVTEDYEVAIHTAAPGGAAGGGGN